MEYCCHVWAGAPSYYLELLDKLQKRICRTVGPSLAASLEPLVHRQKVCSIGITLVDVYLNWLNWFHFLILEGDLLVILYFFVIHSMLLIMQKGQMKKGHWRRPMKRSEVFKKNNF